MINCFENKKILITGHTGFKGSWLASWLYLMGAKVSGISLEPSSSPSHYELLSLNTKIESLILDIRDYTALSSKLKLIKPDYIFNLADPTINLRFYDVVLDHYPESIDECDGYLITGSKLSVYDAEDWIRKLENYFTLLGLTSYL